MLLLELCLLPLLSAQVPAPQVPPGDVPRAQAAPTAEPADVAALAAAERAGADADVAVLAACTASPNAAVANRAAWLLARCLVPAATSPLQEVARASPHADARLLAMQALVRIGAPASVAVGCAALADQDRRVRTVAAQLLGRLRAPAGAPALLALLDRSSRLPAEDGPATDAAAALLALCDLADPANLLPAATTVHAGQQRGLGQALAFGFQTLSPKLDRPAEVTLLVAVLDHREALLRRYAITRLGELADPVSALALERRLASEGDELRPLVEVALARTRRQQHGRSDDGATLLASLREAWNGLSETQRLAAGVSGGVLLLLLACAAIAVALRRRAAAQYDSEAATELVAPSDEYLAELERQARELAEDPTADAAADAEPEQPPDQEAPADVFEVATATAPDSVDAGDATDCDAAQIPDGEVDELLDATEAAQHEAVAAARSR